mgnify:CR=1 FL=1
MTPEELAVAARAKGPVRGDTSAAFRHASGLPLIENPAVPVGYLVPILDERFEYVVSFTEAPSDGTP